MLRIPKITPRSLCPRHRTLSTLPEKIQPFHPIWFPPAPEQAPLDAKQLGVGAEWTPEQEDKGRLLRRRQASLDHVTVRPWMAPSSEEDSWLTNPEYKRKTRVVESQLYVERFNRALGAVTSHTSRRSPLTRHIFKLWKYYQDAKHRVPNFLRHIPDRAWDILWDTQSVESPANTLLHEHLRTLHIDMASVGKQSTLKQRTAYLEAMFIHGDEEKAMQQWELEHNSVMTGSQEPCQPQDAYKPEHLELGARMYAMSGNPDRAKQIMDELYELHADWDPSIMRTVLRAHTRMMSDRHQRAAWDIYVRYKDKVGKVMALDQYDACFFGFLEGRRLEYAKLVYRDMVVSGRLAGGLSPDEVDAVMRRLNYLYRLGESMEESTGTVLFAIETLPQPYHFHLFGDWLKSATVMNSPETAAHVLEFMFQRGLEPQAFHFHVLVKALLRNRTPDSIQRAENIGWTMVEELEARGPVHELAEPSLNGFNYLQMGPANSPGDVPVAPLQRRIPPANSNTFALLMRHHANLSQWGHVEHLQNVIERLKEPPGTDLMNVVMNIYMRKSKFEQTWRLFKDLTEPPPDVPAVFPDGGTYKCLWKTLRLVLGDRTIQETTSLPGPRQMLAETAKWWNLVCQRPDSERFLLGLTGREREIMDLVLHCFSYTKDLPGSLVALHIFKEQFGMYPTLKAGAILHKQMAWIDLSHSKTKRVQFHNFGVYKRNFDRIGRVYNVLLRRRLQKRNMSAAEYSTLPNVDVGELSLNVLSEFVRVVMVRQHSPQEVEDMIDQAKRDMGFPDLKTGDLDAFNVA